MSSGSSAVRQDTCGLVPACIGMCSFILLQIEWIRPTLRNQPPTLILHPHGAGTARLLAGPRAMLLKERMGQSVQSKRARQGLDLCSKQCWVNEAPPGRQAARESASAARCCKGVRFRLELLLWSFGMFGFSRSRLSDSAARLGSVAMAAARCHGPGRVTLFDPFFTSTWPQSPIEAAARVAELLGAEA